MSEKDYTTFNDHLIELGWEHLREEMLAERLTITYRMGGRWFKASSPPMNAFDNCMEVSRIYALPGVSRIMVYNAEGECIDRYCKADWRREDKETDRVCRSFWGSD